MLSTNSNVSILACVLLVTLSYQNTEQNDELKFYKEGFNSNKETNTGHDVVCFKVPVQCRQVLQNNGQLSSLLIRFVLDEGDFESYKVPKQQPNVVFIYKRQRSNLAWEYYVTVSCFNISNSLKHSESLVQNFEIHIIKNSSTKRDLIFARILKNLYMQDINSRWKLFVQNKKLENTFSQIEKEKMNYSKNRSQILIIYCVVPSVILKQNYFTRNVNLKLNSSVIKCDRYKPSLINRESHIIIRIQVLTSNNSENNEYVHQSTDFRGEKRRKVRELKAGLQKDFKDTISDLNETHSKSQNITVLPSAKTNIINRVMGEKRKTADEGINQLTSHKLNNINVSHVAETGGPKTKTTTYINDGKEFLTDMTEEFGLNGTTIIALRKSLLLKNSKDPQWAFGCVVFIILLTLFCVQYSRLYKNCNRDVVIVDHKQVHYVFVKDLVKKRAKHLPLLRTLLSKYEHNKHGDSDNSDITLHSDNSDIELHSDNNELTISDSPRVTADWSSVQKGKNKRNVFGVLARVFSSSREKKSATEKDMIPLLEHDSEDEIYDADEYSRIKNGVSFCEDEICDAEEYVKPNEDKYSSSHQGHDNSTSQSRIIFPEMEYNTQQSVISSKEDSKYGVHHPLKTEESSGNIQENNVLLASHE